VGGGELKDGSGSVHALALDLAGALHNVIGYLRPLAGSASLGLATLVGRPTMFASHLVTNNEATAPPNGFLLLGHFIDADDAKKASDFTGLSVVLSNPATGTTFAGSLSAVAVSYPDERTVAGSMLVAGIIGRPAVLIAVTEARLSTSRTNDTMAVVRWALLAFVAVFAVSLGISLHTAVLRRLIRLHNRTAQGLEGRLSAYATVRGRDEISDLAHALDAAEERALVTEELLRQQADRDALTGLANRRTLRRDMRKSIAEAARTGEPVALAILDLDHFKQINDTAGHMCGDQVLQWFGNKAESVVREHDTVARTGGDEFAILLPHTGSSDAALVLSRLMGLLNVEACDCDAGPITISASCGIAVYPEDANDPEELTRAADDRMYEDKRARERQTADSIEPRGA
jgi:diguanylate cyclase (GGDEF)-like protein